MAIESVVDQIVKSLSFEVEAVPQEDFSKQSSTSNSTPLNVKIRVRKKEEGGMQQGFLSVPKFGRPDANPERIRLISSDQTIMSFNMSMEADFAKKPKKKPRKSFFGGCLGTQYDDDETPYAPSSAYSAKITDTSTSSKSDGIIKQKFTLSKTNHDNIDALERYQKKQYILGKCKPGGCLDPPFGEEKYSYEPVEKVKEKNNNITEATVTKNDKVQLAKADKDHKTPKESKEQSKDSFINKSNVKVDDDATSILSLYDNSLKGSLDSKYSDSVITYPSVTSPSANNKEKSSRNRVNSEEKPRKSYDDSVEAFFSSPKRNSRFNENTSKVTDDSKRNNGKTNIPIPIPIPLGNTDTKIKSGESQKTDIESNHSRTNNLKLDDLQENFSFKDNLEHAKTSIPIPAVNADTTTKSDEKDKTSPHLAESTMKKRVDKDMTSEDNSKIEDSKELSSDIKNPENTKTTTTIPIPLPIPIVNESAVSKSDITKLEDAKELSSDIKNPENTKTTTTIPTPLPIHIVNIINESAVSKPDITKLEDTKKISSDIKNLNSGLTTNTVPMPIVDESAVSKSDESPPKKKDIESQPTVIANSNKAAKLDDSKNSSYTNNLNNGKTSVPIPIPITSENDKTLLNSDESHNNITSESRVQDLISLKITDTELKPAEPPGMEKPISVPYTNDSILDDIQEHSSRVNNVKDSDIAPTNESKITKPESHIGSINSVLFRENTQENNKISSYRKPSENYELLQNLLNEFDDRSPGMDGERETTSMKTEMQDEQQSFTSTPETYNYHHLENNAQNQKELEINEYVPEDSGRKIDPKDSPIKLDDIVRDPSLKSDIQSDGISKQSFIDRLPVEYNSTKIIKSGKIEEDNDDTRSKNISLFDAAVKGSLDILIKTNQEFIKDTHLESNGSNNNEAEAILQEKSLSPDKNLQKNSITGTIFDNENLMTNKEQNEPIKYNRFLKPSIEEHRNIGKEDANLILNPIETLDQYLNVTNSPQNKNKNKVEQIKTNIGASKQSSFVKDNLNVQSVDTVNKTHGKQLPDISTANFELKKPTHGTRISNDIPSIEPIAQAELSYKGSLNTSKLEMKPSSTTDHSKDNAGLKYKVPEISSKTSLKKGSISLDLAFQSYVNDRNERTLKTIDTSQDRVRYPDDSVTVIKSHLRPEVNEIRIPIDVDNDMTIQIHRTKSATQLVQNIEHDPFDSNKPKLSQTYGLPDIPKVDHYDIYSRGMHENIYGNEIPTILNSVYEQELLPLQKTIKHLKREIDSLANQQSMLIGELVSAKKTKPVRLLRVSSRCVCFRK